MPLSLKIENIDQLPDGGPVTYTVDKRGLDIGRDPFMDWTLPDPQRFISGTHCHIRYENGGYWIHDVSTNGTMLNGQDRRLTEPHKLKSGDRLYIGGYIVVVAITGEEPAAGAAAGGGAARADQWTVEGAADPVDRRQFQREAAHPAYASRPVSADLPDENIGWGMEVGGSAKTDPSELDWGVPTGGSGGGGAAPDTGAFDWGTPAATGGDAAAGAQDWGTPTTQDAPTPPVRAPAADTGGAPADWRSPPPEPGAAPSGATAPPAGAGGVEPPAGAFEVGTPGDFTPPPTDAFGAPPMRSDPPPRSDPPAGAFGTEPPATGPAPASEEPLKLVNPISVPNKEVPAAAPPAAGGGATGSFIAAFERGAGLPAGAVSAASDEAFGEMLGQLLHLTAQHLQAMLMARQETKSAIRSSEVTHIGALENNPLKFSPSIEDALKVMFGEKTRSYLDARQTVEQSFTDLEKHQLYTFNAMQQALTSLIEDLDPEHIAGDTSKDGGLAGIVSSRRAKLWDTYVERFRSKSSGHQRGMVGAFMILFAEKYDQQG